MIPKLINDLMEAGLSEKEIGAAIGRDQSSVNRMRNGKVRTDYETGLKLEQLHREKCPDVIAQPPQADADRAVA